MRRYDVAVVGSGFGGSIIAMIARRLGLSVVLLEKGTQPRVVIGESSTPLSNLLLETLADRYDLSALRPLSKWGTWQQAYPHIGCGLKRGFTFFHHPAPGASSQASDRHLLVAASPNEAIADTHWFRADVDQLLVNQAQALGVDYLDSFEVHRLVREPGSWSFSASRHGQPTDLRASFVIDATGPHGFLHSMLVLGESALPDYPATSALYGHFSGVRTFHAESLHGTTPPYPPDAAALHHVFDGGWMWLLPFNNGWTSAGFVLKQSAAESDKLAEKQPAWERLLDRLPEVREQFTHATPKTPLTHVQQLSFLSDRISGDGWAMLPSAAGFVDPLLSTGIPLTLLGIERLALILEQHWAQPSLAPAMETYAEQTRLDLLATADLIGALYANMADFPTFSALTLLYFTAATYAETARRLGKDHLASSFLLHSHPVFGPGARLLTRTARHPLTPNARRNLEAGIYDLIAPFDLAGLTDRPSNRCYPVRADSLFAGRQKIGATHAEIHSLLLRSGFPLTSSEAAQ